MFFDSEYNECSILLAVSDRDIIRVGTTFS